MGIAAKTRPTEASRPWRVNKMGDEGRRLRRGQRGEDEKEDERRWGSYRSELLRFNGFDDGCVKGLECNVNRDGCSRLIVEEKLKEQARGRRELDEEDLVPLRGKG